MDWGLVAAPETAAPAPFRVSSPRADNRKWPSYHDAFWST